MKLVLRKAKNKRGLVPVQKLVTKNGKSFMQTFYVKPDSTPAPPKEPEPTPEAVQTEPVGPKMATSKDYVEMVKKLMETADRDFDDRDERQPFIDWVESQAKNYPRKSDVDDFLDDVHANDWHTVELAVRHGMDIEDAYEVSTALGFISRHVDPEEYPLDTLEDWWSQLSGTVIYESEIAGLYYADDYFEMPLNDSIEYMLDNLLSPSEMRAFLVREALKAKIAVESQKEAERQAHDDTVVMDDYQGKSWTWKQLRAMGSWVRADSDSVQGSRGVAKGVDAARRENREYQFDNQHYATIFNTVTANMSKVKMGSDPDQGEAPGLYRGTKNKAWREVKEGDVIPLGMASFSKDITKASNFATSAGANDTTTYGAVLHFEPSEEVYGVDIHGLWQRAFYMEDKELGEAIKSTGIADYPAEKEVIVRAPSIRVKRVERPSGDHGKLVHVYIETYDMELVDMMKAVFKDRISELESIFDYRLHAPEEPSDFAIEG